jgi:hypothetical protein
MTDRKRKYGEPTEMVATRMPASLHQALRDEAERRGAPKSDTLVALLTMVLPEFPKKDIFE